jgi:hypothetical protein
MLLLIFRIVCTYLLSVVICYGIAFAYFEHLRIRFSKDANTVNTDVKTEGMALSIAIMSLIGIWGLFRAKNFKYCGLRYMRDKE